jgi:peroxiredoxin
MTIEVGDRLPEATLIEMTDDGAKTHTIAELTAGKRVVLFGLPGAFTPTCSAKHVPGYVGAAESLKAKAVDDILCVSVNDHYVMGAWGKMQQADGRVRMLADGNGTFARALGLAQDMSARGLGVRSQRYSLLAEDGVVIALNVEAPGEFKVSDADTMLRQLRTQS